MDETFEDLAKPTQVKIARPSLASAPYLLFALDLSLTLSGAIAGKALLLNMKILRTPGRL
jgi:hypothetical protein